MKMPEEFLDALKKSEVTWIVTREDKCLFDAVFQGEHVQVRMNDFPDEPIYTVFLRGEEIDLEEGPRTWHLQH
jgi:hypothetical protein